MSEHFSWQAAVISAPLESTTKLTLLVIGSYMNQRGGGAFPSYGTIAKDASLGRATVIRHVDVAVQAGWLKKTMRTRPAVEDGRPESDSNLYAVSFPDQGGGGIPAIPPLVSQSDHPGISGIPPVVSQRDPNTTPLTPQGTPNKPAPKTAPAVLRPDDVPEDIWADFLQHRKTKKAVVTNTALKAMRSQAEQAGVTLADALAECCARGWTGFKAEWMQNRNGNALAVAKPGGGTMNKQEALEASNREVGRSWAESMRAKNSGNGNA